MLIVGTTGCRGDHEPGNAAYDERVLGIPHQEFEKDDGCPPSRKTHNHQDVCFHFASRSDRNFFLAQEKVIRVILDMIL